MANTSNSDKWYFTKEQLEGTPSRKAGFDALKELSYRQQAANFIQDMGQRLKVSQLCINTAIVYMHRFYVFHSFTNFPWYQMAAAALFLAAKVEEQPRKLEYVIRVANLCRNPRDTNFDINSERYIAQSQDLVFNENVLLQTLGFDVAIDHPHTHVVRCCHLVRASKDLAQSSYFMASNSLHLTTMCLQYKPTVVACFCIMVACKWSNWEIPLSIEKKEWFTYVDPTVTAELLQQLTNEFLTIFENCPSRLKEKIMAFSDNNAHLTSNHTSSPFDQDPKKIKEDSKDHSHRSHDKLDSGDPHKQHRSSHSNSSGQSSREQREYKERKERERLAGQKAMVGPSGKPQAPHGHHKPPVDPKLKPPHPKPPYPQAAGRAPEPRDILREASHDTSFGLAKDASSKRDFLLKPNEVGGYVDQRLGYDKRASHVKSKHESSSRRHDDQKPYLKQETDNIKKHLSASLHDKNNAYLKSNSQNLDATKSVPKVQGVPSAPPRTHHHNGNGLPLLDDVKIKQEPITVKEEIPTPAVIKRPSLFSPEQSPTYKPIKTEPATPFSQSSLTPLSPILSPETKRTRNYSSSSEPELRPVMKKIDQVEGFENLMRDSTIGVGEIRKETPPEPPIKIKEEIKVEHPSETVKSEGKVALMNGLETNPTAISNLLKEAPTVPHLPTVAAAQAAQAADSGSQAEGAAQAEPSKEPKEKDRDHKNKKKKEKHKRKDKDKSKEDKEKKKKRKDKDREKHRHKEKTGSQEKEAPPAVVEHQPPVSEPIKIKINIQKDKVKVPSPELPPVSSNVGLIIKISKDKIKTESIGEPSQPPMPPPSGGIKIKISKDVIANCTPPPDAGPPPSGKKRERQSAPGGGSCDASAPPAKLARQGAREPKQNGRHHHHHHHGGSAKVVHSGDGEHSVHRLAESKYAKGSS